MFATSSYAAGTQDAWITSAIDTAFAVGISIWLTASCTSALSLKR